MLMRKQRDTFKGPEDLPWQQILDKAEALGLLERTGDFALSERTGGIHSSIPANRKTVDVGSLAPCPQAGER